MNKIETALKLAEIAHADQFRRIVVEPYIEHPKRIAHAVSLTLPGDSDAYAAALLHDAVEDSDGKVTLDMIREQVGVAVAEIVALLTHDPAEDYHVYVDRLAVHRQAREIKRADLLDNMANLPLDGRPRWAKYLQALTRLSYAGRD